MRKCVEMLFSVFSLGFIISPQLSDNYGRRLDNKQQYEV